METRGPAASPWQNQGAASLSCCAHATDEIVQRVSTVIKRADRAIAKLEMSDDDEMQHTRERAIMVKLLLHNL